jgi:transposase
MDNRYRIYDPTQSLLISPDLQEWLPENHLARILCDVLNEIDLSAFYKSYDSGRKGGRPAYHPLMMVRLLAYGYCTGVYSSRKLEAKTYDSIAFRYLTADQQPDHDSIAAFRKQHLASLEGLFSEILQLCAAAGMVKLGHVATDGSKVQANASKHKAMSYERMQQTEKRLESELSELRKAAARELLEKAEQIDAEEDRKYGKGNSGDGIPEELARRESRLAVIRKAKAALEEEARKKADSAREKDDPGKDSNSPTSAPVGGKASGDADAEGVSGSQQSVAPSESGNVAPDGKSQRNFTDPESRIMVDGASKAFIQAYNTQISVDADEQVIVAAEVTQETNDKRQLAPMMESINEQMGRLPEIASADAGYFSEAAVSDPRLNGVDLYIPPERQKHGSNVFTACAKAVSLAAMSILGLLCCRTRTRKISRRAKTLQEQSFLGALAVTATMVAGPFPLRAPTTTDDMRYKLRTSEGKKIYSRRKAIVEPVYGQIKGCRGFRRFSFRGLSNVAAEWKFVAAMHNLLKLVKYRTRIQAQDTGVQAAGG